MDSRANNMSLCPHTQSKLDDMALLQPHTVATYESCCLELRIVNPRNEARICSRSLIRQCFSSTSHKSKLIPKRHSNNQHTIFHFFHHDIFNYSMIQFTLGSNWQSFLNKPIFCPQVEFSDSILFTVSSDQTD